VNVSYNFDSAISEKLESNFHELEKRNDAGLAKKRKLGADLCCRFRKT